MITIRLELTPDAAAALKRFAEKVSFADAAGVLYPHVKAQIRTEQASQIISAFAQLDTALEEARVSSWPWIDSGRAA